MTRAPAFLIALLALMPWSALGAEWGGIRAGVTTPEQVRERYGRPTSETRPTVEGYETLRWVYEGGQAPVGFWRMTVEFGLLTPSGYNPSAVRVLRLDPKPSIFSRTAVLDGWGTPDAVGKENERTVFFYRSGVVVVFDQGEVSAASLFFTPPQPVESSSGSPPAGGAGAAPPAAPAQPPSPGPPAAPAPSPGPPRR